jgi:hypothetical protein
MPRLFGRIVVAAIPLGARLGDGDVGKPDGNASAAPATHPEPSSG